MGQDIDDILDTDSLIQTPVWNKSILSVFE